MNEPIKYREYIITYENKWWLYRHEEFTGAEDKRFGACASKDTAMSEIDNMTIEEQEHHISILRKKIADLELDLEVERRFSAIVSKENFELKN